MNSKRSGMGLNARRNFEGWLFLVPAVVLIVCMSLIPAVMAFVTSFTTGTGANTQWGGLSNYMRILKDKVFLQSIKNCFFYLIIQVPIMLVLALILASMLNNPKLKCKGILRTCIFLPCATSLVAYAIIFRTLFATDGLINLVLTSIGILNAPYNFLAHPLSAKIVIIIALIWRWTGYNMVFYLSGLQNIDYSVYEAARIDGASPFQIFTKITIPLLKPTILLTAIMSTNGTLQLFDESVNLTNGGPANASITMSHYIYNQTFQGVPKFGYTSAMSFLILFMVAVLAFIQMKVGDKRD
ncbi:MAG: sugar ABC transporter permease [Lachnospiraceae bacterium]|nr:sugar ABC transporter permease [Lachnospiraceae bacterium]